VGPRAGADTEARGKILCLCRRSKFVYCIAVVIDNHPPAASFLPVDVVGKIANTRDVPVGQTDARKL
jgi:hypothetical protein